jgi:hypothetical protein
VLDDKSPKLYFLPNLDCAKFNAQKIEETTNKAQLESGHFWLARLARDWQATAKPLQRKL